jgi:hypothetical protein
MTKRDPTHFMEVRPIGQGTEDLDIAFWQAQGPEAIFRAAWELVVTAHELKGGKADELRLQRPSLIVREAPG